MTAYYNEIEPQAAQWLRNLIAAGHIAPGVVDERSILDVRADDLVGFTQCHFFAGIGVWSHALRRAGWSDERPVWTGSCPCQPFSDAGAGRGFDDERHLWPAWFSLIEQRRPPRLFGEQVASKSALAWLDHVSADLEGAGYAVGALDLCAAGFGAPHIRQRLFFVAHDHEGGRAIVGPSRLHAHGQPGDDAAGCGPVGGMADARGERVRAEPGADARAPGGVEGEGDQRERLRPDARDGGGRVGNAIGSGLEGHAGHGDDGHEPGRDDAEPAGSVAAAGAVGGWWAGARWIACIDGKARPIEPGSFPLVDGAPARLVRLRAYGNAIVAPVAEEFIGAYMSAECNARCTSGDER